MREIRANWYEYPHLYDVAFGWDPDVEVDFLEDAWQRFADGSVRCVYEPFCGTGRIAIELAARGYRVHGLDLAPPAIDYARNAAAAAGVTLDLEVGDATTWAPPESIDALAVLIDSFRHLHAPGAAEAALARFAAAIRPGGVLILGLDVGEKPVEVTDEESWTMQRGSLAIETAVFDTRMPGPTPDTTIVRAVLLVEGDGEPYSLITDDIMRTYSRGSLLDLVESSGFETCGVYDRRYDLDKPAHPNSTQNDIVAVFRRA